MSELAITSEARQRLERTLQNFDVDSEGVSTFHATRVPVEPRDAPLPALYRTALLAVGRGRDRPSGDKTAWEVRFRFKGRLVDMAYMKYGLRLFVDTEGPPEANGEQLARELVGKLKKASDVLVRDVLEPLGATALADGRVTVANQAGYLRGAYEHFRTRARTSLQSEPESDAGFGEAISFRFRAELEGSYDAIATTQAFFSLLEHTLVLALAFTPFDPSDGALTKFIGDKWSEKFKRVFPLADDAEANAVYAKLHGVAETYQNTYGHGGFDKRGAAIWVQLPDTGALPAALTDIRDSPHFNLFPVRGEDFEAICRTFDATDAFLAQRLPAAAAWVARGLAVAFDPDSRHEYAEATATDTMDDLIDRYAYITAQIANFE